VGRALESLRNSDFDTLSAIGEVIDNSIEAKTKKIHISLDIEIQDRKRELLKRLHSVMTVMVWTGMCFIIASN
jgi:hypothetical protein